VKGQPRQYILGLGSNQGKRADILGQAIALLAKIPGVNVLMTSPAVDSDPVGFEQQPNFLNICLLISCYLNPDELMTQTAAIETSLGRVRSAERNGPRTIDIDLLFYEGGSWASSMVTLPHPRWSSRGFVVIPLGNLLQVAILANGSPWGWLKTEVEALTIGGEGLRAWQGPTPWIQQQP
jgi:2-amino-4-hydroxy-6-hydroxymethyldihydropteridine diphosphokinase